MKTRRNYKITEAHSGTTKNEIRKAKRLYRQGVKKGQFPNAENIGIVFTDSNNIITAKYTDLDDYMTLGYSTVS